MSRLLLVAIAVLAATPARAMDFKVAGDQLIMSGRIDGSELAKLRDVVAEHGYARIRTVILRNSPGGDVWTSLRIGERVRENGWATAISGYCFSACTVIYLGGVSRHFTDDRPAGFTQIAFHGAYAREDGLRSFAGTLDPQGANTMRGWLKDRTGGKMSDALIDRFFGIENRKGMLHFFDSRRLRRKDGASVFFCTGEEESKKKWDQCQKLTDLDVYRVGVVTSPVLLQSNDRAVATPASADSVPTPPAPAK